jgi:hypothetical protein
MEKQFSNIYPQKWAQIIILIGFCLTLFFFNLNRWDLWNPDEPRYAQVAKEMVTRGDWILMHYNGEVYPDKAPLFFWLIALSSYLWQGFTSFAVRFPAALFGMLTVLFTFLLGRILFHPRIGFFSGTMLVAGAVLPWIVSVKFPSHLNDSFPLVILLVGGSLAMFVLYRFKNHRALFLLLIGIVSAGYFYSTRAIFPHINHSKSARFLSQEVTSRIQPGGKLAVYGRVSTAPYNFYTGIVPILNLAGQDNLFQFLSASERVFWLITFDEWRQLQRMADRPELYLIARHQAGENDVVLISNRLDKGRNL